jgi:CheY-like chemotaxis protein
MSTPSFENQDSDLVILDMKEKQIRVLSVDDEPIINDVIHELLSEHGYTVDSTMHVREALKLVEINNYDVLITDFMMPGIDGITFAIKVKEKQPNCKIIVLTGSDEVDNMRGTELIYEVYHKPVNWTKLLKMMSQLAAAKG